MSARAIGIPPICGWPAIISGSPERTEAIASSIAPAVFGGLLIAMRGTLGAGKTLFASALGAALGIKGMRSPSFAIESIREARGLTLVHADLYRLDDASDETAQIEEHLASGCAVIVEWADRWPAAPAAELWEVDISPLPDGSRAIEFAARGERASDALAGVWGRALEATVP